MSAVATALGPQRYISVGGVKVTREREQDVGSGTERCPSTEIVDGQQEDDQRGPLATLVRAWRHFRCKVRGE